MKEGNELHGVDQGLNTFSSEMYLAGYHLPYKHLALNKSAAFQKCGGTKVISSIPL